MIISHKHKFIFIKTRKTAGTSIEIALSKHCGPMDVITPIATEDEEVRRRLGYRGPQNWEKPWYRYGPGNLRKFLRSGRRAARYWNHVSARTIRENIKNEIWTGYFKFCFERNPWDKTVSHFHYYRNKTGARSLTLDEYLKRGIEKTITDHVLYCLDNDVVVDEVCRFEDLQNDFARMAKLIGLPEVPELPRTKSGFRKDKRPLEQILTPTARDQIAKSFAKEIELFGYTFENRNSGLKAERGGSQSPSEPGETPPQGPTSAPLPSSDRRNESSTGRQGVP